MESGSKKTVAASANETLCFCRLEAAFVGSHSNLVLIRNQKYPTYVRKGIDQPIKILARQDYKILKQLELDRQVLLWVLAEVVDHLYAFR